MDSLTDFSLSNQKKGLSKFLFKHPYHHMTSFIEESFNHGTTIEYRYTSYKQELISN